MSDSLMSLSPDQMIKSVDLLTSADFIPKCQELADKRNELVGEMNKMVKLGLKDSEEYKNKKLELVGVKEKISDIRHLMNTFQSQMNMFNKLDGIKKDLLKETRKLQRSERRN